MIRNLSYMLLVILPLNVHANECEEFLVKPICYNQHFKTIGEIESLLKEDEDFYSMDEISDLNGDGIQEIMFVGNGCNKNCDMAFFTKEESGYRMIGRSGGQYVGPAPLPEGIPISEEFMSSSKGFKHIAVLNQSGWAEGFTSHYMYNGQRYISAATVSYH